jgi:DNA-binding NtrC family response regulator
MKNDLNDVKNLIFELVQQNNLEMPDTSQLRSFHPSIYSASQSYASQIADLENRSITQEQKRTDLTDKNEAVRPIIIDRPEKSFGKIEVVEENLSLMDMEKDLICKALKKHNGRRKDAADDLGISERTLYRKIKEYGLD